MYHSGNPSGAPLKVTYRSLSSGEPEREIVLHWLIQNGLHWDVRAFDQRSEDFRDFYIARNKRPVMLKDGGILPHEKSNQDIQWTRIVELELVPHPDQPRPEIAERGLRHDRWHGEDEAPRGDCRLHPAQVERRLFARPTAFMGLSSGCGSRTAWPCMASRTPRLHRGMRRWMRLRWERNVIEQLTPLAASVPSAEQTDYER